MENQEPKLSPAEKIYATLKKNTLKYQREHPEKCREKCQKYWARMREERPEQYELFKEKKRQYYRDVIKPKMEAKKKEARLPVISVEEENKPL
jgi:hypothetical protein